MTTKYEILAALIDAQDARYGGDDCGWHHVATAVLQDLQEWETTRMPAEELALKIYDTIAECVSVPSLNREKELEPGEIDPVSGRYRPED